MKVLPKFHGTRQRLEKPILEFLKLVDTKLKNVNNSENKNDIEIIYENLEGIPKIEGNSLKLKLNNEEREIETLYIHTIHKLLEMLYRLKTEGFASFM
ncbi:hypothetical protein [Hydrogenothermus marinus]|uniref:hypothetical protein n=1 Tax=Hydrogenothermus marinus TaxID=133270 RepID=UPI001473DA2E|nr:hypothetical protein [Hydrogenothermus marinus]